MKESKKRSFNKTISWRIVAVINSYTVLIAAFTASPLWNAVVMNISGAIMYYIHERFWNKINKQ